MCDPKTEESRGGAVTIVLKKPTWWEVTPVLEVTAEHWNGTEDWGGTLEVRGLSNIAEGFYLHPGKHGGFLKFTRVSDSRITEQGYPHAADSRPFERLLVRRPKR